MRVPESYTERFFSKRDSLTVTKSGTSTDRVYRLGFGKSNCMLISFRPVIVTPRFRRNTDGVKCEGPK